MIITGVVVPAQPNELTGVIVYVAVIGAARIVIYLIIDMDCYLTGSAATFVPAVPCTEASDITGTGQLKSVPAGVLGRNKKNLFPDRNTADRLFLSGQGI